MKLEMGKAWADEQHQRMLRMESLYVLIEREDLETGELLGRSARFAPEVDGEVRLRPVPDSFHDLHGTIVPALITGSDLYDLRAEIVQTKST